MSTTASPEPGATRWLDAPRRGEPRTESGSVDAATSLSAETVAVEPAPTLARIDAGVPDAAAQFGTQRARRDPEHRAPAGRRPRGRPRACAGRCPRARPRRPSSRRRPAPRGHARRAQQEHPGNRRVGPGAEPVDQRQRPARVGGPVNGAPRTLSEPATQDAGQRSPRAAGRMPACRVPARAAGTARRTGSRRP